MADHDQGRIETGLARSPFFGGEGKPFSGRSLLGSEEVAIRPRRLSSRDLAVLAYVIDRYLWPPPEDEHKPAEFTLYALGQAIYGRAPAGDDRRQLRATIARLWQAEIVLGGIENDDAERLVWERLLIRIESEVARIDLEDWLAAGRQTGALRGSTFKLTLAPWLAAAVRGGHFTWLDFRVLRRLRGTAARLWVYLEAETWKETGDGRQQTWIGLGHPALATLGVDGYARHRDARQALKRAGARIAAADPRYDSIDLRRRAGGWVLVATRLSAERRRVREAVRASLSGAPERRGS
jgi:hypothetical protein